MQHNRYIVTVKSNFTFLFTPQEEGEFVFEDINVAAEDNLIDSFDDFDGFSVNDKYELIKIASIKKNALVTFEAEFKIVLDVWEDEDDSDMKEQLGEMFNGELISHSYTFDEQLN